MSLASQLQLMCGQGLQWLRSAPCYWDTWLQNTLSPSDVCKNGKGVGRPYLIRCTGSRDDSGVQTARLQVIFKSFTQLYSAITFCHICGYLSSHRHHCSRLPWPVPSYTPWWQRHMQFCPDQDSNSWFVNRKFSPLAVTRLYHDQRSQTNINNTKLGGQ